jgi:hypothetical protein
MKPLIPMVVTAGLTLASTSMTCHAATEPRPLQPNVPRTVTVPARRKPDVPVTCRSCERSTAIYLGPKKPADAKEGNWIQTMPGKGWLMLLRLYSPKESFFDTTWRLSEVAIGDAVLAYHHTQPG